MRCVIYISKCCWLFWDRAQNMLIFGRRCNTPLIQCQCFVCLPEKWSWKSEHMTFVPMQGPSFSQFLYTTTIPQCYLVSHWLWVLMWTFRWLIWPFMAILTLLWFFFGVSSGPYFIKFKINLIFYLVKKFMKYSCLNFFYEIVYIN